MVYALGVVSEEFGAEIGVSQSLGTQKLQFARYVAQRPVALAWRHEVYAQSRHNDASVASLFPVEGEGEEVVVAKVHHREQFVHQSVAQPMFGILANLGVGVPSTAPVALRVVILAYGRAAHLHPRLYAFYTTGYSAYDACYVVAALVACQSLQLGQFFGIAYVVEVDAVYVVGACHFGTDACQIVGSLLGLGIHVAVGLDAYDVARHLLAQQFASHCVPFAYRHGDNPCMQLHATEVAFVDGKLQSVVAGSLAGMS